MVFAKNIRLLREMQGLTQAELGAIAGVSDKAVSTWELGQKEPRMGTIERIARHFGLNVGALVEENGLSKNFEVVSFNPANKIPIIGRVPAGEPMLAEQYIEGYTYIDIKEPGDYFALRVTGDSMNAAKIHDGDLVIVKRQCTVENGQIAVVIVNGFDGTVKKYYQNGSTVTLMPVSFNPEHQPKMVDAREVTIVGRVVQSQIFF